MQQMMISGMGQQKPSNGQLTPLAAGAQMIQKLMLMKALQANQQRIAQQQGQGTPAQQGQANAMLPQTNAMIGNDPTMQNMQASPQMDPQVAQQLQQALSVAGPYSTPTPGSS
jgi:hypothetical protein